MKRLLDENLSVTIVAQILDLFPGSSHVKTFGLLRTDDSIIWSFAEQHDFTVVSKDADFQQRSLVFGAPPKFIFLRVGNCPTSRITELLRSEFALMEAFINDRHASVLVLSRTTVA